MKYNLVLGVIMLILLVTVFHLTTVNAQVAPVFTFGNTTGKCDGELLFPTGISVGKSGNVIVSDTGNNQIQVFTSTGGFIRRWGGYGAGNSQFNSPAGITTDNEGNIYVVDTNNYQIKVFTSTGSFIRKWGSNGARDDQFQKLNNIAMDNSGNIYVSDVYWVKVFTPTGGYIRKFGGYGYADGQFTDALGIACDNNSGNIYVTDTYSDRIQVFTSTGGFVRSWHSILNVNCAQFENIAIDNSSNIYLANFQGLIAVFTSTGGFVRGWGNEYGYYRQARIAVDNSGNVYTSGPYNNLIAVYNTTGTRIYKWGNERNGLGEVQAPRGIELDNSGNVYITDANRVQVFSSTGGFIRRWGGYGTGNGEFSHPEGLAIDKFGNIYVADRDNNRIQVFTPSGDYIRQWPCGHSTGIAIDDSNNVYVCGDQDIQVFTSTGGFIRRWGGLIGCGNGWFNYLADIAIDNTGLVYLLDYNCCKIQVFTSTGGFVRQWGDIGEGNGTFQSPHGITIDNSNKVYVTGGFNYDVQIFNLKGGFFYKFDVSSYKPYCPLYGIAVSSSGLLYIADEGNDGIFVYDASNIVYATADIIVDKTSFNISEIKPGEQKMFDFNIANNAGGELSGEITTLNNWLQLSTTYFSIDGYGQENISVVVDNNILNQGKNSNTGTITITSNGGNASISFNIAATCVLVKPNPLLCSSSHGGQSILTFYGDGIVPGQTEINIYTLSGELIDTIGCSVSVYDNKGEITWQSQNLAPGVYLYTYNSSKEKGVGKFTVVK